MRVSNNKGFSLVELMVVVAIIGILSAIAIPSINKYMAKARQSEAKSNLASIYTANKAFFAEYNVYDTRFSVIGYRPEGQFRYNIGWATAANTALANYGYTVPGTPPNQSNTSTFCQANNTLCRVMTGAQATLAGTSFNLASNTWVAGAGGRIGSGTAYDTWTINQTKMMSNTNDGTN